MRMCRNDTLLCCCSIISVIFYCDSQFLQYIDWSLVPLLSLQRKEHCFNIYLWCLTQLPPRLLSVYCDALIHLWRSDRVSIRPPPLRFVVFP